MTGIVGNKWTMDNFEPMGDIPTAVNLTTYAGGPIEFMTTPLEDLAQKVADGKLRLQVSAGPNNAGQKILKAHANDLANVQSLF